MKPILTVLLIAALAAPAMGGSCQGGKCLSPAKRQALKRQAMKTRLATPVRVTPAMQQINQQIVLLLRTNVGGRNNAKIKGLHNQRNQMVKAMR